MLTLNKSSSVSSQVSSPDSSVLFVETPATHRAFPDNTIECFVPLDDVVLLFPIKAEGEERLFISTLCESVVKEAFV